MRFVALEYHPNDSRIKIAKDDVCQTLNQRMGTGGATCHWCWRQMMKVYGFDSYNQAITEELSITIRSQPGGELITKVVIEYDKQKNIQPDKLETTKESEINM